MIQPPPSDNCELCVVADDVRLIRRQLAHWMEDLGYHVIHASCGATALKSIRQQPPSIVVTDIEMPHFSGLHLLLTLRRDPDERIRNLPVVVCSGIEDAGIKRVVRAYGGSAFLAKPIDKRRFLECVRRLTKESESSSGGIARC